MNTYRTLIDVDQAARSIAGGDIAVFDCSFALGDPDAGRASYEQAHLPTARYLHLDHDLAAPPTGANGRHPLPDPSDFSTLMRANGVNAGQQVIAYDASGGAYAARLWWLLRWLGHDRVALLDGGRQAWITAGKPMESGAAPPVADGNFSGTPRAGWTVTAGDVLANIADLRFTLVDARLSSRFAGEPHPMDPVSGHVPGARNRFYGDNLDATGRFKSPASLQAEFDAALAGQADLPLVLHCGSGVTACHNLLALEIAGRPGARLYPGSWSEWIEDPARPVDR